MTYVSSAFNAFSSSASPMSVDYRTFAQIQRTNAAAASPTTVAASPVPALLSPKAHITELQSAWRANTAPTFIDSVTDLVILGEGSSGVVYRGLYRGLACVVKLPKSASLTGAGLAWRELHCHACLPPHDSLVRFLGALPMSATNYLVLCFVRQGSLHSLLTLSTLSGVWYRRPYGVMHCIRDMSAVLHHIHSCGIVHRDVSCRNILVDSDGRMVLADLGLARQTTQAETREYHTSQHDHLNERTAVPVRWTSPESLAIRLSTPASPMYGRWASHYGR